MFLIFLVFEIFYIFQVLEGVETLPKITSKHRQVIFYKCFLLSLEKNTCKSFYNHLHNVEKSLVMFPKETLD